MKAGKTVVILAAVFAVLCVVFGAMYLTWDRTAPVITVGTGSLQYRQGDDYSVLLQDISAVDGRDGDLTKSVIVEKILPGTDGKATVRYAVRDQSGNIATATRVVKYTLDEETDLPAGAELDTAPTPTPDPKPTATPKPSADPSVPSIQLSETKVSCSVGEELYLLGYVESVSDDNDSEDELYRHIDINGEYDFYTAGTYDLEFVVSDSEGNASRPAKLVLTVTE